MRTRFLVVLAVALAAACSTTSSSHRRPAPPTTATTTVPATTAGAPAPAAPPATTASPRAPGAPVAPSLSGVTVLLDAGHNGGNAAAAATIDAPADYGGGWTGVCDTVGAASADGYPEHAYTFDLTSRVADLLRAGGTNVVLTRTSDAGVGPCVPERAAIGNRARATIAVSIHADGNATPGARGFHVIQPVVVPGLTDDIAAPSARFATLLADWFAATGMPRSNYAGSNGIATRDDLGGLRLSDVPKVFIETGNLRDPADLARLRDPAWRDQAAAAIANAISQYVTG